MSDVWWKLELDSYLRTDLLALAADMNFLEMLAEVDVSDYSASAFLVCISYHCFPLVLANSTVWCSDSVIWCSGRYSLHRLRRRN
jgi:Gpi18-like mannosyltransferase